MGRGHAGRGRYPALHTALIDLGPADLQPFFMHRQSRVHESAELCGAVGTGSAISAAKRVLVLGEFSATTHS